MKIIMRYVPDTSTIISGKFYELVKEEKDAEVIIPEAVIAEIEAQANRGLMIGYTALSELEKLKALERDGLIKISFYGERPDKWQIERAKAGEIDNIVRKCALETESVLVTGDFIQHSISKIKGVESLYLKEEKKKATKIEDFFDAQTMSVHIKAGVVPVAKKGRPGYVEVVKIRDEPISEKELNEISQDVIERAKADPYSIIELDLRGATVIQLREYRIAITKPPFSEALEITAVKPTVKLSIEDYNVDEKLFERLKTRAEGVLISGSPGAGKSTFVQALAEMYLLENKVVKTIEKPRDLLLSKEITRYTALEGDLEKTGDLLLLVRPDYTIFDEMRTTQDFKIYADLRLTGVGMVGVVHASRAIDAVQRMIGRIELGMITQIIDTIIHISKGKIEKALVLEYTVKVPSGMMEADLARPVINVLDFHTGKMEYEIYSFGEQIVVIPIKEKKSKLLTMAEKELERVLKNLIPDEKFKVEMIGDSAAKLYVREDIIPYIIGKAGKNVAQLEHEVGVHLEIKPMKIEGRSVKILVQKKKNHVYLYVGEELKEVKGQIFADKEYLFNAVVSRDGVIKVRENTDNAMLIINKIKEGKEMFFVT